MAFRHRSDDCEAAEPRKSREELKEERKAKAEKHIGLMRGVFGKEIECGIETAVLYEDGEGRMLEVPEPRFEQTAVELEKENADRVILKAKGKSCVIDPASYRRPGSGFANGAWTVEAQLCAESTLFPVLEGLSNRYYAANINDIRGELYSDRALFLPDITFTAGGMTKRTVVVCAPPDAKRALENHRSQAEIDGDLANRVETVMRIAAANEVDVLVIPAFGCGALGNDAEKVAALFKSWIESHDGVFERVVFAVGRGPLADVFESVIVSQEEIEPEPIPEVVDVEEDDEDDEDDEDWRNYMSV